MAYEVGNDVTCNVAVRQAMNYGVDRARMIDHVLNGFGTVAWSVGDGMPWASPDMEVETDAERARALLAEDGWTAGGDGVLEKDGVRAAFDLYYAAGDSVRQALASDFASQMPGIGIEVNVKGASWDEIYLHQFSSPVLWGWGSNSPVELYELTHSQGWGTMRATRTSTWTRTWTPPWRSPTSRTPTPTTARRSGTQKTHTGVAPHAAATWIWLANVDHLYFQRTGLHVAEQKPHPHGHGWSLVNNVDKWTW